MSRPRFAPALSTALLAAVVTATGAWAAGGSGSRPSLPAPSSANAGPRVDDHGVENEHAQPEPEPEHAQPEPEAEPEAHDTNDDRRGDDRRPSATTPTS